MTEKDYSNLIEKIANRRNLFKIEPLIKKLNKDGVQSKDAIGRQVETEDDWIYLKERLSCVFEDGTGLQFSDLWVSVVNNLEYTLPEETHSSVLDFEILNSEFERQYLMAEKKYKKTFEELCAEVPQANDYLFGYDFSICFVCFIDSDDFSFDMIFELRLMKLYNSGYVVLE